MTGSDESRRSERARTAILDATVALVGERGYAKLTIEAIAAKAGVGKQTIYRWWPSKGAVVLDAFVALAGGVEEPLEDSGDLEDDLRRLIRATVVQLQDPLFEMGSRAILAEAQTDLALARRYLETVLRPMLVATEERLRSAQKEGQLRRGLDLAVVVDLLYGAIFYRWLLRSAALGEPFADSVVDLVLEAAGPRTARRGR